MRKWIFIAVIMAALVSTGVSKHCAAADTWTQVIPGVQHVHRVTSMPWDINVLIVDLTNPRVKLRVVIKNDNDYPGDGGETVKSMCRRYGAAAGINTDFWGGGTVANCPQGHTWTDGLKMLPPGMTYPPNGGRTHLQIPADNAFAIVNKVLSQPAWFFNVTGGGPRVIRDGVVGWEYEPDVPDMVNRHPRTAAAVSQDYQTLILATCDGRITGSVGMTANEMGNLLKDFGGYQGVMLDGGGSTTMVIDGQTVNRPSDGSDRRVAAGLLVLDRWDEGSWVTAGSGLVRSARVVSFESSFDNPGYAQGPLAGQDGWVGGGEVTGGGRDGSWCARFFGSAGRHTHQATSLLKAVQWAECWMKVSSAGAVFSTGTADLGSVASIVRFHTNGKIEALDGNRSGGGNWLALADYTAGVWYRVHVRLDYNLNSYQVFVDSALKASGIRFRDSGANTGFGAVGFEQNSGADLWVDDIYIGSTDPEFLRVSPDAASVVRGGTKTFRAAGGTQPVTWSIVDEKLPDGSAAAPGSVAAIDAQGVLSALSPGKCVVRVQDSIGRVDDSEQVIVIDAFSVEQMKQMPNGAGGAVSGLVVSGVYDGFIYAQQPDRSAGIRVLTSVALQIGDVISAAGSMTTADGERVLAAETVELLP